MDTEIKNQVNERLKKLLFDTENNSYRDHELFYSEAKHGYCFLIWKMQPRDLNEYGEELKKLTKDKKYQFIPGACEVSTYDPDKKTG